MQVARLGITNGLLHIAIESRHLGRGDGGGGGTVQVAGLCHSHHLQDKGEMDAFYIVVNCFQGLMKNKNTACAQK